MQDNTKHEMLVFTFLALLGMSVISGVLVLRGDLSFYYLNTESKIKLKKPVKVLSFHRNVLTFSNKTNFTIRPKNVRWWKKLIRRNKGVFGLKQTKERNYLVYGRGSSNTRPDIPKFVVPLFKYNYYHYKTRLVAQYYPSQQMTR